MPLTLRSKTQDYRIFYPFPIHHNVINALPELSSPDEQAQRPHDCMTVLNMALATTTNDSVVTRYYQVLICTYDSSMAARMDWDIPKAEVENLLD
jgi:hypothetical protein